MKERQALNRAIASLKSNIIKDYLKQDKIDRHFRRSRGEEAITILEREFRDLTDNMEDCGDKRILTNLIIELKTK